MSGLFARTVAGDNVMKINNTIDLKRILNDRTSQHLHLKVTYVNVQMSW